VPAISPLRFFVPLLAVPLFAITNSAFATENVRIGTVLSLSGPASLLGESQLKVLKMYTERINAAGGVNGKKVSLVSYDDASDASKANQFTKRLIDDDKVDVIVGGTTSGSTLAMIPSVEKAGVPFVSLAAAIGIVEPVKRWVFKMAHTDRQVVERVFEDMRKRGIQKLGILTETSGFGQSGRKEIQAAAPKYGITLVADETYALKDTDVSAQLTRLKAAPGLQAILVFGLGQGPVVAAKNMEQLQIHVPVYQSNGVASLDFVRLAGSAAEKNLIPSSVMLAPEALPASDPQRGVAVDFKKFYLEAYPNDAVSYFTGLAHDGLMVAVNAIKTANSLDKERIRTAIEGTKNYAGVTGTYTMTPNDHMGLAISSLRIFEVKNKEFVLVK
jgi:branched-chain amino acid transport system substrate-binding protein